MPKEGGCDGEAPLTHSPGHLRGWHFIAHHAMLYWMAEKRRGLDIGAHDAEALPDERVTDGFSVPRAKVPPMVFELADVQPSTEAWLSAFR